MLSKETFHTIKRKDVYVGTYHSRRAAYGCSLQTCRNLYYESWSTFDATAQVTAMMIQSTATVCSFYQYILLRFVSAILTTLTMLSLRLADFWR